MADVKELELWTPESEWLIRSRMFGLDFMSSEKTAWFFIGMAVEAFDIAFSTLFNLPYHPAIDFVIWTFVGMLLFYWQKKHPNPKLIEEDEVEEDEDDEDATLESKG